MTAGIYHYVDVETDEVVYIGKDSSINRSKRHLHHKKKSNYNKQPFNRVLQNNPDRYRYEVVCAGDYSPELLSILEINEIAEFKMLHNGELPKFNFTEGGEGSTGYKHSEETKQKIGESISKSQNTTGYLNVCKQKDKTCKQGFIWRYQYYENSKRKGINAVDIKKLEKKVKEKGLTWKKL